MPGPRTRILSATFTLALAIAAVTMRGQISGWWLLAPAGAFLALVVVHNRVIDECDRLTRAIAFYQAQGLQHVGDTVFELDGNAHRNLLLALG